MILICLLLIIIADAALIKLGALSVLVTVLAVSLKIVIGCRESLDVRPAKRKCCTFYDPFIRVASAGSQATLRTINGVKYNEF